MVNKELKDYITNFIIPKYSQFDKAHSIEHVTNVIDESLKIVEDIEDINIDMVYVVAAFHDMGMSIDRKYHHIHSGKILEEDELIQLMFSEDQIKIMKEAVEDHRASGPKPRNIYGMIISDADREYNFDTIIKRCILYRDNEDIEKSFQNTLEHIKNKYRTGGYLKNFYIKKKDKTTQELLDKFCDNLDWAYNEFKVRYNKINKL